VGSNADLDAVAKRKKHHCTFWELDPGRPFRSLLTILNYRGSVVRRHMDKFTDV